MKKLSLLIALSLASIASYAQTYQVFGHIQDGSSNPVVGQLVTVNCWNQFNATGTTDANGDYSVDIPDATPTGVFLDVSLSVASCSQSYYDSTYWTVAQDFQSDFTVCGIVNPPQPFVYGQITTNNVGAPAAVVYLVEKNYDPNTLVTTLTALDSVYTDTTQGYYHMDIPSGITGSLLIKAALLSTSADYGDYLPTYFQSSLTWNGIGVLNIPTTINYNADIDLIAGVNPGGPGFVGGDVLQGANKSSATGDPLQARILILTTAADVPVGFAYTDVDGHFTFPSLALGSYKLFGDAAGKLNPALTFTLTAANPTLTSITFEEHSDTFEGSIWATSVATAPELSNVSVYPNPVADVLNVAGLNTVEGAKTVTLTGINGAVAFNQTYQANEKVSISVSGLSAGMYMLQINTVKGNAIYKIVK